MILPVMFAFASSLCLCLFLFFLNGKEKACVC